MNLEGVRRLNERERKAQRCNNCYRFGHITADYKIGKQYRKCSSIEHLAADCNTPKETLTTTCGYCREHEHKSKECTIRKEEERMERINHRNT